MDRVDRALQAAHAKATKSGERVRVPSRETETMQVWANPDGKSLHAELSTTPVQLEVTGKDKKKSWQPIDTSIEVRSDGTLAPKLVKTPLTFGGKDDKTLVTAKDKDGTVSVGWDRKLPQPAVDGNKITYRDAVTKGADLVLTALPDGFIQDVVLRTRPKGPVKVSLPVSLPRGKAYGKAADGRPQLMSPEGKAETAPLAAQAVDAMAAEAPEQGKTGKVDTIVTTDASGRSSLVLTPDAGFLADATVTYPVTISMSGTWIGAGDSSDTFVSSRQYPNSATLSTWLRAGRSADGELWRTYLRYVINGTDLDYATIHNADLRLWNYHANACGSTVGVGIVARRLTSAYDHSTLTWANQPSSTGTDAVTNTGGYSATLSGCSGSGELYYSIENIVQAWVDGTPDYGLMIRAATEGVAAANWRQYRSDQYTGTDGRGPVLFIDYEPAPRASIVYSTLTEQTTNPTYEQAVALQDYQPEQVETAAVSDQFTSLLQSARNAGDEAEAYSVGTDKLDTSGAEGDAERGDDVAPSILSVTPSPGAAEVPVDTTVTVTFSEETIGASIVLKAPDGTEISGTTTATGTTSTFTPSSPLAAGVQYTATVSGAQDIWDNTLEDYSWIFATVSNCPPVQSPDTTAPTIRAVSPAANAIGVATGSPVSVTFCEPVTNAALTLKDSTSAAVEGTVVLDQPGTTVTFTPSGALTPGAQYTAEVNGAADAAGNVITAYSWSFTTATADTTPPAVTATTPESGATNVAVDTQVRVTYGEPVTGVQIAVTDSGGGTIAGTVTMPEGTVAVFTPAAPLSTGGSYTVTASGATDAAGNTQTAHNWSFTTVAPSAEPVNPNPYFESELSPWETWSTPPTLTRSTERAHQGVASAKLVTDGETWGMAAEQFAISEGGTYRLSGWVQPVTTDPLNHGVDFGIEWYSADGPILRADNFVGTPAIGEWQAISGTVTAPADAATAVIYIGGGATLYFDEIMLLPTPGVATAQADGPTRQPRTHGPSTLLTPKGAKAKLTAKARTSGDESETVRTASTPFSYDHISMEDCLEVARKAGIDPGMGRGNVAHLVVRPYSMCWSRYINKVDYVWAKRAARWVLSGGRKGNADSVRLQYQATWVMHSYLGNAAGDGVVNGGTTGLKPQQIKVWTKVSNIKTYRRDGSVTTGDDDEYLRLEVKPTADSGSTCRMTSGSSRQADLAGWKRDGDDEFVFTMQDTDGDKADKCTLRPTMIDVDNEWTQLPVYLWSQVVYDLKGQLLGKRTGGGDPSGTDPYEKPYTPHVRCDWYRSNSTDPEGQATSALAAATTTSGVHTGGCIFPLARRIFIMSKSRDASFLQVIEHIEAALKQDGAGNLGINDNKYTVPPLRDNETQDPPVKGLRGTEKTKTIPGNWAAPHGTEPNKVEAGDPLVRGPAGTTQAKNRGVFSRSFTVDGVTYANYCRYYFPNSFVNPLRSRLEPDPKKGIDCDEYPFASTKQGAYYAKEAGLANHYSLRAVGQSHNRGRGSHGVALGSFYTRNRVMAGDPFWVWIVN
ncbi:Ig-like domain-containing protein [Planobispora rosea]|uniref:Ig-like domain-containing protein n=1 Tax=Planobispora rosea TaxID=35762 RepID=UPI00159F1300|nr:Ig-like domain-containing protein [Planobispora rosea]